MAKALAPSLSQQIAWWANFIVLVVSGIPMAIVPLKQYLPEHYYGALATGSALFTFLVLTYQNYRKSHPYPDDDTQDAGA